MILQKFAEGLYVGFMSGFALRLLYEIAADWWRNRRR